MFIIENELLKATFIVQAGTLTVSGLDSYHNTKKIAILSYAKPDLIPAELKDFKE